MRGLDERVFPRAPRVELARAERGQGGADGNFRFYRRVSIFPGLSVNVSKSGPSLTVGMRGAHVTVGRTGIRKTVGIPGTGIYYTSHSGYHSGAHSAHVDSPLSDGQQSTAHNAAQLIFLMFIVGAFALSIALVVSLGGPAASRPCQPKRELRIRSRIAS